MATKKQKAAASANLVKARAAKAQKNHSSSSSKGMDQFKMEAASEVGVNLSQGKSLTTAQAGRVGGQMVKKMVESYEKGSK